MTSRRSGEPSLRTLKKRAEDWLLSGVCGEDAHLYHLTPSFRLDTIRKEGLIPRQKRLGDGSKGTFWGWDRWSEDKIFFSTGGGALDFWKDALSGNRSSVRKFPMTVLRLREGHRVPIYHDWMAEEECSFFTLQSISPKDLEVEEDGRWVPLVPTGSSAVFKTHRPPLGPLFDPIRFEKTETPWAHPDGSWLIEEWTRPGTRPELQKVYYLSGSGTVERFRARIKNLSTFDWPIRVAIYHKDGARGLFSNRGWIYYEDPELGQFGTEPPWMRDRAWQDSCHKWIPTPWGEALRPPVVELGTPEVSRPRWATIAGPRPKTIGTRVRALLGWVSLEKTPRAKFHPIWTWRSEPDVRLDHLLEHAATELYKEQVHDFEAEEKAYFISRPSIWSYKGYLVLWGEDGSKQVYRIEVNHNNQGTFKKISPHPAWAKTLSKPS